MDKTEELLQAETRKWLAKLERDFAKAKIPRQTKEVREQLTNIKAYMSDCTHFLEKGDLVRAFEAAIYAWGIFETLERLDLLRAKRPERRETI